MRGVGSVGGLWPLVGRSDELARFTELLEDSERSGVVLRGPGGVGKTRLAAECGRIAERRGFVLIRIVATQASQNLPFGAFAVIAPTLGESSRQFFAVAAEAIAALGNGRRVLLMVDDAHLLDGPSAVLLHQLVAQKLVSLLATVRTGESTPDEVAALWTRSLVERIEIEDLSADAVEQLLDHTLVGSVDDGARAYLHRVTQGNPLTTRELLLSLLESGTLSSHGGHWSMSGALAATPRLAELIQRRLSGCSSEELAALEVTALGEPVPLEVLECVVDPAVLEDLERRTLLTVLPEPGGAGLSVRLSHPLHGEALRVGIGPIRQRNICRTLADAADRMGMADGPDLVRVAVWRATGGGAGHPDRLLDAARRAYRAEDFELALKIARAAYATKQSVDAGHLIGWILSHGGELEAAEEILAEIVALEMTEEQLTLATMARSENLVRLYRVDEAIALTAAAIGEVTGDFRDELRAHLATFEALQDDPDAVGRSIAVLESLVLGDGRGFLRAAPSLAGMYALDGRTDQAIALCERAYARHVTQLDEHLFQMQASLHLVMMSVACTFSGRFDTAAAIADGAYSRPGAHPNVVGWGAMTLGIINQNRGRVRTALRLFGESARAFPAAGLESHQRWALARVACSAGYLGDVEAANRAIAELDALGPRLRLKMDVIEDQGRAWAAVLNGDVDGGMDILERSARRSVDTHQRGFGLIALHDLARLGGAGRVVAETVKLSATLEGPLNRARCDYIIGVATRDPEMLTRAADTFESCGALLFAAEAAAQVGELLEIDSPAQALASAGRARRLWQQCEGAITPTFDSGIRLASLTERERRIATLAATGLTSRAIADRLFLSTRTVENHLQRAYAKTGVNTRQALKDLLVG